MTDRFVRQADFVPARSLAELTTTVIGVGSIGRQVALQLAAIGAAKVQLIDFDNVEPTNITTQGYLREDLGLTKVEATRKAMRALDPEVQVDMVMDRFRPHHSIGDAVFCCVDSIASRAAIWRAIGDSCLFWSDGRMLGEVLRILTVADETTRRHYATTLFGQSDAEPGRCTARSTIYAASIAAGLMVHQFARWLRRLSPEPDVTMNLLSAELVTVSP